MPQRRTFIGQLQQAQEAPRNIRLVGYMTADIAKISIPFVSPPGGSGTFYFGGYYYWHGSSFTPAGGTNVGTANASYAAHVSIILGAASTDMVVRVTGTSINDFGTRTTSDTEDLDTSGGATNAYYETNKKFIGQVSVTLQSGTGVIVNCGFTKYYDNDNDRFIIRGIDCTWLGGANDSGANISLLHHKQTGWTYGAGGTPTPPAAIIDMNTDHNTEINIVNGQPGAWKRADFSKEIIGDGNEGILLQVVTSANAAFRLGNAIVLMDTSPIFDRQ